MSVYQAENPAFLDRSLQSIWLDQTLYPDEVILVEDGPLTDGLYEIINKWKTIIKDHLIILKNEVNEGLTKSLNKGISIARGDYIARMDSDDISMPDRFQKQAGFLDTHSDIMVIGGSLQEFNLGNECINIRKYPLTHENILKYIHKASPLAHPTVMMRRKIFDNGLCYDERYRTSQDIALWFDVLSKRLKIENLEDVTLKFRCDGDVFRRRSRYKAKNEFKIYMNGIYRLFGLFTLRYFFPIARYVFRLMPVTIVKTIYESKLRQRILQ